MHMCVRVREKSAWGRGGYEVLNVCSFSTGECLRANKSRSDQEVDDSEVGNTNIAFNMLNVCHMKTDKHTSKTISLMDT